MSAFTLIKTTFASLVAASSSLFSSTVGKLGSVRVAHPAKVDDVLPAPKPVSIIEASVSESSPMVISFVEETTVQPSSKDGPSDAQFSPLVDYKSPILSSISATLSWSTVLSDSIKTAAAVEWTIPGLIVTSPSTATIEADESELNPYYLRPDGDFLNNQELQELSEIDFDDDGTEPPILLVSAQQLRQLTAIAEDDERSTCPLTTIVEANEPSYTLGSSMSSLPPSLASSLLAEESTSPSNSVPESAFAPMMTSSFSWSDIRADDEF